MANESVAPRPVGSNKRGSAPGDAGAREAAPILTRLERRIEELAEETTEAILREVGAFGPIRDERLREEVLALATAGIGLLVQVMGREEPPTEEELGFIRDGRAPRATEQA